MSVLHYSWSSSFLFSLFPFILIAFANGRPSCLKYRIDIVIPFHRTITIHNPYGKAPGIVYDTNATDIRLQGWKYHHPNYPIDHINQSDIVKSEYNMLLRPAMSSFSLLPTVNSSSSRNFVSLFSHFCLLIIAAFFAQKGRSPILWVIVVAGMGVFACEIERLVTLNIVISPSQYDIDVKVNDSYTTLYLSPKKSAVDCKCDFGRTYNCSRWKYEIESRKDCKGPYKGTCPNGLSCTLDSYSANLNFTCINISNAREIAANNGVSFGYVVPNSTGVNYKSVLPRSEGSNCGGNLERQGNCKKGFYCLSGKCVATTKRDGKSGYNAANKAEYYCKYPTSSTTWVYYFSVYHHCTLAMNKSGNCPYATAESKIFGGPNKLDGVAREAFTINGTVPGPTLYACVGDTIEVHVTSHNMSTGVTIHWHGLWQRYDQYSDGVAQVTQCPIMPNSTQTYIFKTGPAMSTWYHSHSGLQYGDGMFGGVTIYQLHKQRECRMVDHYWDQKSEGLLWAQWKNTWCNPYKTAYKHKVDTFLIHDWYHEMSTHLYQGLFFGSRDSHSYGRNTSRCNDQFQGISDSLCIGGGPTGDTPWVSGLINGKGQYSGFACGPCSANTTLVTNSECGTCQKVGNRLCGECGRNHYHIEPVTHGHTYRMTVLNSGIMWGLRFSIDGHTLRIIAQDEMYVKPLDVQEFTVYPGQRIEFLVHCNQSPTKNYWMRARTYPPQDWLFEQNETSHWYGSFVPGHWSEPKEILGVLQYNAKINQGFPLESERKSPETYSVNGSTPYYNMPTLNNPKLKAVYNMPMYSTYTAPTVEHHSLRSYYSYTAVQLSKCDNKTISVNGIMYPNYQLSLNVADGIVNKSQLNIPVVFARPHVPISLTKGLWGLRNMTVYAGFKEYPPMFGGIGNYTHATYLVGNRTNLLYIRNPGPMVHPFHLHGHSFALLAVGRTPLKIAKNVEKKKCCKLPKESRHAAAEYYNLWGNKWYDRSKTEWISVGDLNPMFMNDSSLLIPGVSQRADEDPVVDDPYGRGSVNLKDPMIFDTIPVPSHGWALVQFVSDNPGSWFFHCHIEFHVAGGMGFVFISDPNSWDTVYPIKNNSNNVHTHNCQDIEFLGPNQYW